MAEMQGPRPTWFKFTDQLRSGAAHSALPIIETCWRVGVGVDDLFIEFEGPTRAASFSRRV